MPTTFAKPVNNFLTTLFSAHTVADVEETVRLAAEALGKS